MNVNQISNRTIIRILTIIVVFVIGMWLIVQLQRELFWFATAGFLALTLNPAVSWMQRNLPKRNRIGAIMVVFLVMGLIVSGISYMLVPPLLSESQDLIQRAPNTINELRSSDNATVRLVDRFDLWGRITEEQERLLDQIAQASGSFVGIAQGIFDNIIGLIVVLTLAFFTLIEGPKWVEKVIRHQPAAKQKEYWELVGRLYRVIRSYTLGNLLRSLIITIATIVPLTILGIPYALPLSMLMGILNLIPLIGATIGSVIVVLVCLFVSIPAAIFMAIYFIVYQQLENNLIQPLIFGHSLQLSALTVLAAALVGASLAGLLGAFVAIPVAASIRILYEHNHRYGKKRLEARAKA